jgi:tryptophan 2,3-dioxygenase
MPTYGEYLRTDELLGLQSPLSDGPEHDEMLFIVIHQVYELWFKQVLHELDYLECLLSRNDGDRARHTLKRILTILKVMVAQLDILETMTPLEFLSFRDRLEAGSGFQSHQCPGRISSATSPAASSRRPRCGPRWWRSTEATLHWRSCASGW